MKLAKIGNRLLNYRKTQVNNLANLLELLSSMEGRKALQKDQNRLDPREVQQGQVPGLALGSQPPHAELQTGAEWLKGGPAGRVLEMLANSWLGMSQVCPDGQGQWHLVWQQD